MQCCSNKRVTVYLSNLFLCPTYNTCLHFSSIFFFSTLKFDFFLELRTVKSSSCPFWRICFAAVCIENGLADLKTWMLQKSSWMTWWATHRSFMELWDLSKREVSVDFWSCTTSNVARRWGWNRSFELLEGWGLHRLDVEGPEASMVHFYGLLEVKMFFLPWNWTYQKGRCFGKWFLLQIWLFYVC